MKEKIRLRDARFLTDILNLFNLMERGYITENEYLSSFFRQFAYSKTDELIEQVIARLPRKVYELLKKQSSQYIKEGVPEELFIHREKPPSATELSQLLQRVLNIAKQIELNLTFPIKLKEVYTFSHISATSFVEQSDTDPLKICKKQGCNLFCITLGVYCPKHHFEKLQFLGPSIEPEDKQEDFSEFYYKGMVVGIFKDEIPYQTVFFDYEAYRGPGHYDFAKALNADEQPICKFRKKTKNSTVMVTITIKNCPEKEFLQIVKMTES